MSITAYGPHDAALLPTVAEIARAKWRTAQERLAVYRATGIWIGEDGRTVRDTERKREPRW